MTNRNPSHISLDDSVVESMLESITDDEALNKECHRYVMLVMFEGDADTVSSPVDTWPDHLQNHYWELYASRTREIVIMALTKL